ncbi:unnamed protein product [Caenorhabditis auriculariae]|uniref:SH3 domain-containing protein n=1 Tax=Caenorhabditis auriculariae TaxID=2777116 RepID=A0A8S1HDJ3_9PELO|nr:unnamed protein product [Caenorhabditis auriculariae]
MDKSNQNQKRRRGGGGRPKTHSVGSGRRKAPSHHRSACDHLPSAGPSSMHSAAREHFQAYLNAYKYSTREQGTPLVHNSAADDKWKKHRAHRAAVQALRDVKDVPAAFAVQAQRDYDGSLDQKTPLKEAVISFAAQEFIHIHLRYNDYWWIGRLVKVGSPFGFVPTPRRLAGYMVSEVEESPAQGKEKDIWEPPCPYTVVPSTRPIVLLGPTSPNSRLTQLLHLALREEILKHFGDQIRYLKSDIGNGSGAPGRERSSRHPTRWLREGFRTARENREDDEQREVETMWRLTSRLHLLLLDSPNIHTPDDVQHLPLAPIFFLIRVSDSNILLRLLRQTNSSRVAHEIEVANTLMNMNDDRVGDDGKKDEEADEDVVANVGPVHGGVSPRLGSENL